MHASQANHSIKALKAELVELGGSCDGCTEKAELLERLAAARARGASFKAPGPFAAPKSQPAPADNSPEAQEVRRVLETAPGAYYFILHRSTQTHQMRTSRRHIASWRFDCTRISAMWPVRTRPSNVLGQPLQF